MPYKQELRAALGLIFEGIEKAGWASGLIK